MARIARVNIPTNKRVGISLRYIYSITPQKQKRVIILGHSKSGKSMGGLLAGVIVKPKVLRYPLLYPFGAIEVREQQTIRQLSRLTLSRTRLSALALKKKLQLSAYTNGEQLSSFMSANQQSSTASFLTGKRLSDSLKRVSSSIVSSNTVTKIDTTYSRSEPFLIDSLISKKRIDLVSLISLWKSSTFIQLNKCSTFTLDCEFLKRFTQRICAKFWELSLVTSDKLAPLNESLINYGFKAFFYMKSNNILRSDLSTLRPRYVQKLVDTPSTHTLEVNYA